MNIIFLNENDCAILFKICFNFYIVYPQIVLNILSLPEQQTFSYGYIFFWCAFYG